MKTERQQEDNLAVGARGGIIAFALMIVGIILGFLNQIVLARILGAEGLGEVILAITIVNTMLLIAGFGMQGAMVRFVPYYTKKQQNPILKGVIYSTLLVCFLLSVVCVALILIFSKSISVDFYESRALLKLLPAVAVALPAIVFNNLIQGILKGFKDTFKALLPHSIVAPFLRLAIFLFLCAIDISTFYAVLAFTAGEVCAAVLSMIFLFRRLGKDRPLYQWKEYKKVLGVALTMIFTSFSYYLYTQADILIVGKYVPMKEVGVYAVVAKLVLLITFSLNAFSAIIPSIISAVHTSGDHDELRRVVGESTRWILSISIPVGLFFIIEGRYILKYLYGDAFVEGYMPLMILTVGQLINAGSGLVGWCLQMTGGHKTFMKITVFWGILNIILNIILVPILGINGAALSTAFTLSMVNIVSVWVIYKKLNILTLAKGLSFDIIFAAIVAVLYLLINYNDFFYGDHLLLITALTVYIGRAIVKGDLPWKYILSKYKTV